MTETEPLNPFNAPAIPILDGEREGERVSEEMARDASPNGADSTIDVPSGLLLVLNDEARKEGLPHLLPSLLPTKLDGAGRHTLHHLTRIHPSDGPDFFRCQVETHLVSGGVEFFVLDLTTRYTGMILGAMAEDIRDRRGASAAFESVGSRPRMANDFPRWAGAISYGPVAARAKALAESERMQRRSSRNPARQVLSIIEAAELRTAHVIRVDPEQVEVLPEWESDQEVIEFGVDAQLPFESIYLDFEGPGGIAPRAGLDAYDNTLTISGALMFWQGGMLMVVPYGWSEGTRVKGESFELRYESPGWFMFSRERLQSSTGEMIAVADKEILLEVDGTGARAATIATDYCIGAFLDDGAPQPDEEMAGLPGWAVLPFDRTAMTESWGKPASETDIAIERLMWWADLVWKLVKKSMAALSIVEAEEVELVEARMEKRDRKRAEKRGWPIADQVVIRPRKRYAGDRPPPSGEEARYSHRFWRRGTYAHYPLGTRMANARPDLVRPCPRIEPAGNCGFCRRVWHPPCIVGPDDKPLVLKTLVQHPKKKEVA